MPRHNPGRNTFKGRSYRKGGENIRNLKEGQMDEDLDTVQIHEDDAYEALHHEDADDLDDDDSFDDDEYDDSMDGDHESALASAGFGTDEDYGYYGGDDDF